MWRRMLLPVLLGMFLAGCGHLASNLGQRELVVIFKASATQADREKVRVDCAGSTGIALEPLGSQRLAAQRVYNVRYRIDNASDAELARLTSCLSREKSVLSYDIPERM